MTLKKSDGEASVIAEDWRMRINPSLLSLLAPLWPGAVVPNMALYDSNRIIWHLNWVQTND